MKQPLPILRSTLGEYPLHRKRNADLWRGAFWYK
jgi:hypothetical protein